MLLLPTFCKYPQPNAPTCSKLALQAHAPGAGAPLLRSRVAVRNTALYTLVPSSFVLLLLLLLLLCAAFAYFLPIVLPTAKFAHLQQTCTIGARARRQSTSATQSCGRAGYSPRYPGAMQLCGAPYNVVQLVLLSASTFAYFVLLFANTYSQTHPPAANLHSKCTR